MPSPPSPLRRVRAILRGGRLLGSLLALAALAAMLWLGFGLADAAAAFESTARVAITVGLTSITAAFLLVSGWIALRVSPRTAAERADAALGDSRRTAAASLSLDPEAAPTPLAKLLTTRTLEASSSALAALPARRLVPWRMLGLALAALMVPLGVAGTLRLLYPGAFATVASRLLHPGADIPPFTRLVFAVTPEKPAAVYGAGLTLTASITGEKPAHPVECLMRRPGGGSILRLPAFREAPGRFSRAIDGLTEPVEVAFACGKARSPWLPVEILLEPNILGGVVRVEPPPHTGLPATSVPLDTNEIAATEGSKVTLELTSNRPLGSASLIFTPAAAAGAGVAPETLTATLPASHTASFTWTATHGGNLAATLRDVRGTPAPRPLQLAFRCVPDQPPAVILTSPPAMLLATPKSVVAVAGRATDDFALAKVHFVRTLSGFRDRSQLVAPALTDKAYDFATKLDLDELGLSPGQMIELMLDAADHNPSLLGQGSSEISRIRVISEDEYAKLIRARTTLAEFSARFQAARDAIREAREALDQLDKAVEKGDPDAIREAAKAAADAHRKAAEMLERVAEDFPAFEMEKRLKDLAGKQADALRENLGPLEQLDPAAPKDDLKKQLEEMRERLGREQQPEQQLNQNADLAREAGLLMEMAAKFRQIYESQANLSKRFGGIVEELRHGIDQNRRQLPLLGDTQRKNRAALDDFKAELKRRIDALPADKPELQPLLDSATKFLDDLTEAQPESLMDAAAGHGKAGAAAEAFDNAERARAMLERFLKREDDPFAAAARGEAPEFEIPDLDKTLRELLEGLQAQNPGMGGEPGDGRQPGGMGFGPGGMAGGRGDGFPMDNLPMLGPERLDFGASPVPGRGRGEGKPPPPAPPLPQTAETGRIEPPADRAGQSAAPAPESIPEPYRDAVKKFLTPE